MADIPTVPISRQLSAGDGVQRPAPRGLIPFFWILAVAMAGIQELGARHAISQDGVSYIEVAEAYARGDWHNALNAYWSPLYCWILAISRLIWRPPLYWEDTAAHAVNVVIHVFALACFHFFWINLTRYHRRPAATPSDRDASGVLPRAWIVLGYTLFLWCSYAFSRASGADTLVTGFVLLSSGLLLRLRSGRSGWESYVVFGVVLGLGYLAKAILLPLGLVYLAIGFLSGGPFRKTLPLTLVAGVAFAVVAAPFVTALSIKMGRFTTGEAGKLTYAWYTSGVKPPQSCLTPQDEAGRVHATKTLHDLPRIIEFASPVAGTYPLWYDPPYWNQHTRLPFIPWRQWQAICTTGAVYYDLLLVQQGAMIAVVLVLILAISLRGELLRHLASEWFILVPTLTAIGLYGLVHVEVRFLGGFVIVAWAAVFAGMRRVAVPETCRLVWSAGLVLLAAMVVPLINAQSTPAQRIIKDLRQGRSTATHIHWATAQGLKELGIRPGDRVATFGEFCPYWARLAGVRVVAQMPEEHARLFWAADDETRSNVLRVLAKANIRAVVTRYPLMPATPAGWTPWRQLGPTDHYACLVPPSPPSQGMTVSLSSDNP